MARNGFQSCIDNCHACAASCDVCAASSLDEREAKKLILCIRLDMDCAQVCRLAASYLSRGSHFAQMACKVCAEICEACAKECARHDLEPCRRCARSCLACADGCREMA